MVKSRQLEYGKCKRTQKTNRQYKKPSENNSVAIEGETFIEQLNSRECSSDNENSQKVSRIFLKETHILNHSH